MSEALYEVSCRFELDAIRTSFYEFQDPLKCALLERSGSAVFEAGRIGPFFAEGGTVSFVAELYRKKGQQDHADRFLKLVQAVQDKAFKEQKRSLYRDQDWSIEAKREYSKWLVLK